MISSICWTSMKNCPRLKIFLKLRKKRSWRNWITWVSAKGGDRDGIEIEWGGWTELKLASECSRSFIETIYWNQQRATANGQRNKRMLACLATDYWHV
jgi:hypothetical protein